MFIARDRQSAMQLLVLLILQIFASLADFAFYFIAPVSQLSNLHDNIHK